jgi:hypothetical protein
MPLIDLKTDLKSLKYGKDRPGGGNSGQPYQQVDINKVDSGFNRFRMTKFDDGLVRGGVVGAVNASIVDTLRIGKFLKDFPKGPLFITKQVGLQLTNPIIEHKTNFLTNQPTRGQGLFNNIGNFISNIANKILNAVGPTRIYNLGINTLAQIPVNAFGQHIQRHGFTPRRNDDNLYFKVAQHNNNEGNNRLTQLRSILGNTRNISTYLGGPSSIYGIGTTVIQRRGKFIDINRDTTASAWATSKEINDSSYVQSSAKNIISTSNLKIGSDLKLSELTYSKLARERFNLSSNPSGSAAYDRIIQTGDNKNPFKLTNQLNYFNTLGVSKQYFTPSRSLEINTELSLNTSTSKPTYVDQSSVNGNVFGDPKYTYADIRTQIDNQQVSGSRYLDNSKKVTNQINNFPILYGVSNQYGEIDTSSLPLNKKFLNYVALKKQITNQAEGSIFKYNDTKNTTLGTTPNTDKYNGVINAYTNGAISYNNGIDKPFTISGTWATKNREIRVGSGRTDSLNLTPIFSSPAGTIGDAPPITIPNTNVQTINDLVKFRIQALDGDNPALANYMIFRAYITQYSDNTDATWNSVKYAGRGEDFYIYGGFSRKIQIGFKVAALSAEEMKPMYQKLNYLMSNLMPDYKDNLMRGPLVKMTVGNWIDGQDGILTSVSYAIPQDSPWEISLGDQQLILPHVVEVSLAFTPIGSQTKGKNLISSKSQLISNIAQNANADVNYIG